MEKITDNVNFGFPARMSDGRFITDYTPNCQSNMKIQKAMTSWQYRTYLTRYADQIIENVNQNNIINYGCETCDGTKTIQSPKLKQECTTGKCSMNVIDDKGIGLF